MCRLFRLSVRLLINSRLLVVKFLGSQKIYVCCARVNYSYTDLHILFKVSQTHWNVTNSIIFLSTGISHSVALHFIVLSRYCVFFTNWSFVVTLYQATLSASFFQHHFWTLWLCHILIILALFHSFSWFYLLW